MPPKTVPLVGDPVRYVQGRAHKVLSVTPEPQGRFHFVTCEDPDQPGEPAVTLASYLLELNVDNGWTFFPNLRPPPALGHQGDPRYPLEDSFHNQHRRFNQLVERGARMVVARWEKDRDGVGGNAARAWSTIPAAQRERVRRGMRASLLRRPALRVTPPALQTLCDKAAELIIPPDLKQWLDANP